MKYLVLLLLLAACGQTEKKNVDFGKGDGGQAGPCAIPSFYDSSAPAINDLAALPKGTYRQIHAEVFFREEGGDLRAHFLEGQRGNEFVSRKVCTSALPARELFTIPFPGLSEFTVTDAATFRRLTPTIFAQQENFTFTRSAPGPVVTGSISEVLGQWSNWVFYKRSESEYELRLYVFETQDARRIVKLMTLRFYYIPSAQ